MLQSAGVAGSVQHLAAQVIGREDDIFASLLKVQLWGKKRLLDHFNLSRVHGRLLPPRLCEAVPPHPHNGCFRSELSFLL